MERGMAMDIEAYGRFSDVWGEEWESWSKDVVDAANFGVVLSLKSLPLPIAHAGFKFLSISQREINLMRDKSIAISQAVEDEILGADEPIIIDPCLPT